MRLVTITTAAALLAATTPMTGGAQQGTSTSATDATDATDARWEAFVGCWAPDAGIPGPQAVCVVPAGGNRVELVTVADGKIAGRDTIDVGIVSPSTRESCTGTDAARWSPDGRRVYLEGAHLCQGTKVRTTGLMAMPSANEWLDVRGVSVAGGPVDVRVRRYHAIAPGGGLMPVELERTMEAAIDARPTLRAAARANAAQSVGIESVIEASRAVDATVLEAWLVENGDGFDVNARKLAKLADAKVPSRVIDVVVALSFPNRFAIGRNAARPTDASSTTVTPLIDTTARTGDVATGLYGGSVYGGGLYGDDRYDSRRRRRSCDDYVVTPSRCYGYNGYGNDPYGYAGYSPYGWSGSGWGYGYGYAPGRPPVIVVNQGGQAANGRVVNGKGYTRGQPSEGSDEPAQPRSTRERSSTERSNSGSSSGERTKPSTGSSSGSTKKSGSESGGERRTAKPKNP